LENDKTIITGIIDNYCQFDDEKNAYAEKADDKAITASEVIDSAIRNILGI
jgi:hypothetical protein